MGGFYTGSQVFWRMQALVFSPGAALAKPRRARPVLFFPRLAGVQKSAGFVKAFESTNEVAFRALSSAYTRQQGDLWLN